MPGIDPDYVDVAERIREFYDRYPTGSLQALCDGVPMELDGKWYVKYVAAAYRTPDDPRPGVGTAWEPVPGPTPFTKNSELQNAETSAWGRAIIAVGIPSKKIATAQDVQKASPAASGTTAALSQPVAASAGAAAPAAGETQPQTTSEAITAAYKNLEKEVGEDNAQAAYALALHAAGLQPGGTPTYEQAQMIIGNLELALPTKVTA